MMLGPKNEKKEDKAFAEEEELQAYCKFCFAKKFKISILNIQVELNEGRELLKGYNRKVNTHEKG